MKPLSTTPTVDVSYTVTNSSVYLCARSLKIGQAFTHIFISIFYKYVNGYTLVFIQKYNATVICTMEDKIGFD